MTKELTLPSGKIAKIENGKGYDLLQAQIKAKTPDEIPYALIAELTEIDGLKLVYEDILQLDLEDVIVLQEEISGKLKKSSDNSKQGNKSYSLPDSQSIIHLAKVTGWQYSEISKMPIPTLAYWCSQAIKYTNNRNKELEEQCSTQC